MFVATFAPVESAGHVVDPARRVWVQVARGDLTVNGNALHVGDGAAISAESALRLQAGTDGAEALIFDLS